jgi:hypothetical protein
LSTSGGVLCQPNEGLLQLVDVFQGYFKMSRGVKKVNSLRSQSRFNKGNKVGHGDKRATPKREFFWPIYLQGGGSPISKGTTPKGEGQDTTK